MNTCSLCRNSARDMIDRALVDGTPLRAIAEQFGTSLAALSRHRQHLPKALIKSRQSDEATRAQKLFARVERIVEKCEMLTTRALRSKNLGAAIAAQREIRSCVQFLAQLQGLLNSGNVVVIHNSVEQSFPSLSDAELNQLLVWTFARLTNNFDPVVLAAWKREAQAPLTPEIERCIVAFRREMADEPEPGLHRRRMDAVGVERPVV